jgi:hypothetical protein
VVGVVGSIGFNDCPDGSWLIVFGHVGDVVDVLVERDVESREKEWW